MNVATTLLDLLGFGYAKHKLADFSSYASVLGVDLDLRESDAGKILVRNKPSRVAEVSSVIQHVLQQGKISTREISLLD